MTASWQKLAEKIDARVLRERALIFGCLLAVVFLLWQLLLGSPRVQQQNLLTAELANINTEQQQTELQINTLKLAAASELFTTKKVAIKNLQQDLEQVEARLAGLSQGLISASQLPKVLEDVLVQSAQVKLRRVKTLPASELQLSTTVVDATGKAEQQMKGTGVFKHSVMLEVSGGYPQILQLLKAIESLQWKFYWESLDYEVTQYPEARIELRVFTLSSEEGRLGV